MFIFEVKKASNIFLTNQKLALIGINDDFCSVYNIMTKY